MQSLKEKLEKRKIYAPEKLKKDEKEKAYQIKKEQRVAMKRPVMQRVVNSCFVVIFLLLLLGAFNAFRHNGELSQLEEQVLAVSSDEAGEKEDYASRPGVYYFIENFMKTYLTVKPGEEPQANRQTELTRFLAKGLDENAGIDYSKLKGEQVYQSSRILEVEQVDQHLANVYVDVDYTFITKVDKKVQEKKKGEDGKEQMVEKTVSETKETPGKAYYVVQVYGDETGYTVVDLPQPFVPKQQQTKSIENAYADQPKDAKLAGNVHSFLETFFAAYVSKDRMEDMKFFFKDSGDAVSLNGAYNLVSVDDVAVYPGEEETLIVRSRVKLEHPVTGVQSQHGYELVLAQEGPDKFEIIEMKNLTNNVK